MPNHLDLTGLAPKDIHRFPITIKGNAVDPDGHDIDFTNYFMTEDGHPAFGVCGECHYSRLAADRWDDELGKMAAAGITVVSTYIFWNHHEEREGEWDFSGNKNLRRFIELIGKHGMHAIVRLGPFDHGEVRNGGIPDWLHGKPFEIRSTDPGFLDLARKLYARIAEQLEGLYFKDGGPIIGAQLDNEYMHSTAPWEMTTGISDEWLPVGADGMAYMEALRSIAAEAGIAVPFYTCTGWGGSPLPDDVLPLWGGYAYRPWLFFQPWQGDNATEHPLTDEFIYRNFHAADCPRGEEFDPTYPPEERPYACCEMGGGMFSSYNYRFILPMKSVDAMANIKIASGCNVLGYYMFHGGTNPLGRGVYLNEGQTPKRSYDFQAAIGEFGQVRESYRRLKSLHLFTQAFADTLCPMRVAVPEGQERIEPADLDTLRWCVRTDGMHGFVFINNFQDHATTHAKHGESVSLTLSDGSGITIDGIGLAADENCVLPFDLDLDGVTLRHATMQPVTVIRMPGADHRTFVFLRPEGMDDARFAFAAGTHVDGGTDGTGADEGCVVRRVDGSLECERFTVRAGAGEDAATVDVVCVSRALADRMSVLNGEALAFASQDSDAWAMADGGVRVESRSAFIEVTTMPTGYLATDRRDLEPRDIEVTVHHVNDLRHVIELPSAALDGVKTVEAGGAGVSDVMLRIRYSGDIGWLYCGNTLISDNFANGDVWEVGLRDSAELLAANGNRLTLVITPLKEGANVNVESAMAARSENIERIIGSLESIEANPVYVTDFRKA